ncbi:MAG: SRPBCC family protein [Methyloceanibacter sp.]
MRPMMRLSLGLGALVAILAGVALALPSQVTIARSVVINAPESVVFSYLNDLNRFNNWSPWATRDPQLQATIAGAAQGKGARIEWTSNQRSVGQGSMEITESDPNRRVDLTVNFNGLDGTSYYQVSPSGSGSKVIWGFAYDSGSSPIKRWKGLMLDRYVGAEYNDGLTKLKELIESERRPTAPSPVPPVAVPMAPEQPAAVAPEAGEVVVPADAAPPAEAEAPAAPEQAAPEAAAEPAAAPPPQKKKRQ